MRHRLGRNAFLGSLGQLGAGAALAGKAGAAEAFTMRISVPEAVDSVQAQAALHFSSAVSRRTSGQVKIEVYPNGQLFKEQAGIDALATGVLDFTAVSTSFLVSLFPRLEILSAPFLFQNGASAFRLMDGPIGQELFNDLQPKGIVGLSWGSGSFKELETISKVVTVPEDMKGLRIRSQGGAVYVATYQALGAIPVTIDMSEAFTALTQRTLDGIDIIIDGFTTGKFYTVVKHVAMSNHIFSVDPLIGSKRKIDALPAPLRKIVVDEGAAVGAFWRSTIARQTAADIEILKKNGVQFSEIQPVPFRKAMDPIYAQIQSRIGSEFVDRVQKAARTS